MASSTTKGRGDHPGTDTLRAFLRAEETPEEGLAVRRHLTECRCVRCLQELNRHSIAERVASVPLLAEALRRPKDAGERTELMLRVALRGERLAYLKTVEDLMAPELLQELLLRPPEARRQAVRTLGKYQFLGLAEHVVKRTRSEVFEDVARAAELGALGVEVAEVLEPRVYGERELATVQGRAWGALGNALRVRNELREAERAFGIARELLDRGHGAAPDRAEFLSLLGSLRMSQARYEEARRILEEAAMLYRTQGEWEAEARVLVQLGKALGDAGDAEKAVVALARAEELHQPAEPDRLLLFARHCRAAYLNDSGRIQEARDLLERLRPDWLTHLPGFAHHQRLLWLDARISWSEGDLAAAEKLFLEVQRGWEEREEAYDYALVSLDLAALYLAQGRTNEVRSLAERMLPIFRSQDIHHHAVAALVLVQRAVASDSATVALLQEVSQYLHRARTNPDLAYGPST